MIEKWLIRDLLVSSLTSFKQLLLLETWHELPMTDSSSGISEEAEVSNWIEHKDRFPTINAKGPANVVPCDLSGGYAKDMMPQGVKVSFSKHDKNIEKFLAAPGLVKDLRVNIEGPYCQGPSQVKVNVDKNVVKSETFQERFA